MTYAVVVCGQRITKEIAMIRNDYTIHRECGYRGYIVGAL